jgi:microfibrillar-associated protein 1
MLDCGTKTKMNLRISDSIEGLSRVRAPGLNLQLAWLTLNACRNHPQPPEMSSSASSSSYESTSSEDEAPRRVLQKPVFIKKAHRTTTDTEPLDNPELKTHVDDLLQDQIVRNAILKQEEEDDAAGAEIDDTDGLDPQAEHLAWKIRELTRVKRERDGIIAAEKEREEVERRRNLTAEERDAEDEEFLARQREEKESKGQMGFMQRYQHKGAFYGDTLQGTALADRDLMGGRYADDVQDRAALPEFMQIRDMAKLGRKGRSKYKDMRSEDTGRFGDFGRERPNTYGDSMDRKRAAEDNMDGSKRVRVD